MTVAAQLPSLSLPPSQGSPSTQVSHNLSSRDGGSSASVSGRSETSVILQEFSVQFLPPISLMCTLPPSYPSRSPPNFVVKAWWLTQFSLASLCRGLDAIWDAQPGLVVCYAWASWLQENCLSRLGFVDKVMLRSSKELDAGRAFNVRAIAEDIPVDVVITRLLRYNEEKHLDEFCKSMHCCNICFSELPGISQNLQIHALLLHDPADFDDDNALHGCSHGMSGFDVQGKISQSCRASIRFVEHAWGSIVLDS